MAGGSVWGQSITPSRHVFEGTDTEGLRLYVEASVGELRRAWGQFMLPVAHIEKAQGHWRMHIRSDEAIPLDSGHWVYSTWGMDQNQSYLYAGVATSNVGPKVTYMLKRLFEMFAAEYRWRRLAADYQHNQRALIRHTRRIYRMERKQHQVKDTLVAEAGAIPIQRLHRALHKHYARRDSLLSEMAASDMFR